MDNDRVNYSLHICMCVLCGCVYICVYICVLCGCVYISITAGHHRDT